MLIETQHTTTAVANFVNDAKELFIGWVFPKEQWKSDDRAAKSIVDLVLGSVTITVVSKANNLLKMDHQNATCLYCFDSLAIPLQRLVVAR